jgi:DNA replication protein DnaC
MNYTHKCIVSRNVSADDVLERWFETLPCPTCQEHPHAKPTFGNKSWEEDRNPLELEFGERALTLSAWFSCSECCRDRQLVHYGVPPHFRKATFDNFNAYSDELKRHVSVCRAYSRKPGGFLTLLGPVGVGKTHLAVATLRTIQDPGLTFYVRQNQLITQLRSKYNAPRPSRQDSADLIDHLKSMAWGNQDPRVKKRVRYQLSEIDAGRSLHPLNEFFTADFLILDEFGVSTGGTDVYPTIFDLISHRHGYHLPTILCSNLDAQELENSVGKPISDRIGEASFATLIFSGASYRARPETRRAYFDQLPME